MGTKDNHLATSQARRLMNDIKSQKNGLPELLESLEQTLRSLFELMSLQLMDCRLQG